MLLSFFERARIPIFRILSFSSIAKYFSRKRKHLSRRVVCFSRSRLAFRTSIFKRRKNATCGLILYLSDCARTSERKEGSSVEGIVAKGDRGRRQAGWKKSQERNKGVESRGTNRPLLVLYEYEYTSVRNTRVTRDARALL